MIKNKYIKTCLHIEYRQSDIYNQYTNPGGCHIQVRVGEKVKNSQWSQVKPFEPASVC